MSSTTQQAVQHRAKISVHVGIRVSRGSVMLDFGRENSWSFIYSLGVQVLVVSTAVFEYDSLHHGTPPITKNEAA